MEDTELLRKRLAELARRSYEAGIYQFTDFLSLSELSVFEEMRRELSYAHPTVYGGCQGTERCIIRFGDPESLGYEEDFPIVLIKAAPRAEKFADKLTHRDFLGALMNLGIERSTLGDIPILDNVGYIFALVTIAPFIIENLTRVKHTDLTLSISDEIPEGELYRTESVTVQLSGERCDAVIAKVFHLSRDEAQLLFSRGLVFISGRLTESPARAPKAGDIISVRGHGRMRYIGEVGKSKKGKLNVSVELYK